MKKLVLTAIAIALLATGLALLRRPGAAAPVVVLEPTPTAARARAEEPIGRIVASADPKGRAFAAGVDVASPPPPPGIPHRVVARIVDGSGAPIAGAELRRRVEGGLDVARAGEDGRVELDVHLPEPAPASRTTAIEARHPRFATRSLPVALHRDETTWIGDVELVRGASIVGRVEGAGAGVAVAAYRSADRRIQRRERAPTTPESETETDRSGAYGIDGLLEGTYTIVAVSQDGFTAKLPGLSTTAGSVTEASPLRLAEREPEDSIEGRVVAQDGTSLEGVRVVALEIDAKGRNYWGNTWRDVAVEPDGTFAVELYGRNDLRMAAWIPGKTAGAWAKRVPPGARDLELRLPAPRRIVVEVIARETGEPLAGQLLTVHLVDVENLEEPDDIHPSWVASREYDELRTDEDGRVELLEPAQTYWVYVEGAWSGISGKQLPGGEADPGEPDATTRVVTIRAWLGDHARARLAANAAEAESTPLDGIVGRVVANGRPVAGTRVTAHNASGPGTHKLRAITRTTPASTAGPYLRQQASSAQRSQSAMRPFAVAARGSDAAAAVSDASGSFRLTERLDTLHEWVVLRAEAPGLASGLIGPFRTGELLGYDAETWRPGMERWIAVTEGNAIRRFDPVAVEIALVETGTLEGALWLPRGAVPTGRVVAVSRGDGVAHTSTVGPDGRFRFDGLAAGPWQVREAPRGTERKLLLSAARSAAELATPIEWDTFVPPGGAADFDLDLSASACEAWGHVRIPGIDVDGMEARVLIRGHSAEDDAVRVAETRVEGDRFHFSLAHAGDVTIEIRGPGFVSWSPVDLQPGDNEVAIELPTGELRWRGEVIRPAGDGTPPPPRLLGGEPYLLARWTADGGHHGEVRSFSEVMTEAEFGAVPSGRVEIVCAVPELRGSVSACFGYADHTEFGAPLEPPPAFVEPEEPRDGVVATLRYATFGGESVVSELELLPGQSVTASLDGVRSRSPSSRTNRAGGRRP